MDVSKYRKTIVAFVAAVVVLGSVAVDGKIDANDALTVAIAFLSTLGVYTVPNTK